MKMERVVEVTRGWPYDGALDTAEIIKTGSTVSAGDWVAKQSDGTIDISGASASNKVGLVVQGNGDSASAANSNKAVVLWSNFIVKVSNYTAGSYAPGVGLTAKSGKLVPDSGTDPIIATVLEVTAASATDTANVRVLVK